MQRLGGKIEEVTCKDLIDLSQDLYYLILQKLKEKALDLNTRIDEWRNQEISTTERNAIVFPHHFHKNFLDQYITASMILFLGLSLVHDF